MAWWRAGFDKEAFPLAASAGLVTKGRAGVTEVDAMYQGTALRAAVRPPPRARARARLRARL